MSRPRRGEQQWPNRGIKFKQTQSGHSSRLLTGQGAKRWNCLEATPTGADRFVQPDSRKAFTTTICNCCLRSLLGGTSICAVGAIRRHETSTHREWLVASLDLADHRPRGQDWPPLNDRLLLLVPDRNSTMAQTFLSPTSACNLPPMRNRWGGLSDCPHKSINRWQCGA